MRPRGKARDSTRISLYLTEAGHDRNMVQSAEVGEIDTLLDSALFAPRQAVASKYKEDLFALDKSSASMAAETVAPPYSFLSFCRDAPLYACFHKKKWQEQQLPSSLNRTRRGSRDCISLTEEP
jgi:hypothetical protein